MKYGLSVTLGVNYGLSVTLGEPGWVQITEELYGLHILSKA